VHTANRNKKFRSGWLALISSLVFISLLGCQNAQQSTWKKGNLHTHSLWSDGDDYPEMIMEWYKDHGYDFIVLSDHNILAEGEKWIAVEQSRGGMGAYQRYLDRFGGDWVEQEKRHDTLFVRLKTLAEYRPRFEEPGEFLIVQSEEISDRFQEKPIHLNATNLRDVIPPQGGNSVREVLQNNIDAVLEQREATGRPMIPHVNHPNFGWALTASDLAALEGEKLFEVYNGHPSVRNEGDEDHPGTERLWDLIMTSRLLRGMEVMYGVAVDDAHNYHQYDSDHSNPGRGWIMVRSAELTPARLIASLEAGQFYASTGVELEQISVDDAEYQVRVRPETGVDYIIRFIGTRRPPGESGSDAGMQPEEMIRQLPEDSTGVVLKEVRGTGARYAFQGDEIYVRAKIISSQEKENPYRAGELEAAWTQPQVVLE